MYALCEFRPVNTQGFVWKIYWAIYKISFIYAFNRFELYILFNLIYYLDFVLLYIFVLFMPTFFQKQLTQVMTYRHSNLTTSSLLFLPQAYTHHNQQTFQPDDFILIVLTSGLHRS